MSEMLRSSTFLVLRDCNSEIKNTNYIISTPRSYDVKIYWAMTEVKLW